MHQIASSRAMRYTNQVTYSRSSTLAEDMARNLLPFVNAYRQFWQYWIATFFKHPVSISVAKQNYPMADPFVSASEGPFKDLQAFMPSVPFWGTTQEGEDPSEPAGAGQAATPAGVVPRHWRGRYAHRGARRWTPSPLQGLGASLGALRQDGSLLAPGTALYGLTGFNSLGRGARRRDPVRRPAAA